MYFLHNLWNAQSNAITYKELREAIMNGYLDEATLQAWQQDYSLFVKSHLEPIWQQAAKAGADALAATASGGWVFDPMSDAMTAWIKDHGAEWVTKINDETRDAMRAMIEASTKGQFTVDELSRAIRPLIGLTEPQAAANLKYYASVKKNLLDNGVKADAATKKAREQAISTPISSSGSGPIPLPSRRTPQRTAPDTVRARHRRRRKAILGRACMFLRPPTMKTSARYAAP